MKAEYKLPDIPCSDRFYAAGKCVWTSVIHHEDVQSLWCTFKRPVQYGNKLRLYLLSFYNGNLTWPIMTIVSPLIHTLPLPNNPAVALNAASLDKSSLRIFMVLRQNRRFHFCRKFSVKWTKRDAEMWISHTAVGGKQWRNCSLSVVTWIQASQVETSRTDVPQPNMKHFYGHFCCSFTASQR
jgi:hypothetical protein